MIHEEICTYEVCKLAKEKGFDWICQDYYNMNSELIIHKIYVIKYINSQIEEGCITAPTQSLLQRWLREEKNIETYVRNFEKTTDFPHHYWNFITDGNGKTLKVGDKMFDTYELALEDALAYSLENLV